MPEMTAGRRAAGPHKLPPAGTQRLQWDDWPALPTPDQSRYGTATTDPLGREGPGWHTGKTGLPTLRKGWKYDPRTRTTTRETEK